MTAPTDDTPPVLHGDDPDREGNLDADTYWRLAEERAVKYGPCHAVDERYIQLDDDGEAPE